MSADKPETPEEAFDRTKHSNFVASSVLDFKNFEGKFEFAVIGSRATPLDVTKLMALAAEWLLKQGAIGDSGGAVAADKALEHGYWKAYYSEIGNRLFNMGSIRVYLPFPSFEGLDRYQDRVEYVVANRLETWDEALTMAEKIYDSYGRNKTFRQLGPGMRALSGRNMMQVLGPMLDRPKDLIIFYAPPSKDKRLIVEGGTNLAVAKGDEYGVPMMNLYYPEQQELLRHCLATNNIDMLLKKARY